MSGGSGGGSGQSQSYQYSVQPELMPYAKGIAEKAQLLSQQKYVPYQAERIAQFDPLQEQAFDQKANLPSYQGQFDNAIGLVNQGVTSAYGVGVDPTKFTQADADYYSNPYQQNVTNVTKREAIRDYQKAIPGQLAQATQSGAFGGSRHGIFDAEANRNVNQQLQDIQYRGSSDAYTNAQQQFERDRQDKYASADLELRGIQTGLQGASALPGITSAAQQSELTRIGAMESAGAMRQSRDQQVMDQAYNDFNAQRDYPYSQLQFYNAMIRGLQPVMPSQTTNQAATPNPYAQVAGLGLAGASAYNLTR